jgi:hypothetical protein
MNDLQALAGIGEGARTPTTPTAPDMGRTIGGGPAPSSYTDDPAQLHAAIAAAAPEQQALVLQRLRLIDRIAQAIATQTRDPVERARMAQHIAQTHPEMGIDPGMLTPQAMSDANIGALHELASEATLRVALASLGGRGVAGGSGASGGPVGPPGLTTQSPPAQNFARGPTGTSHAAQGFTILGVD